MAKYYAVRIDKKSWTKDTVTAEEFEKRGYTVQDARREGDKDVFMSGRKVATLFLSKAAAAKYAVGGAA